MDLGHSPRARALGDDIDDALRDGQFVHPATPRGVGPRNRGELGRYAASVAITTPSAGSAGRRSYRPRNRLTVGSPSSQNRQGNVVALVMPTRGPVRMTELGSAAAALLSDSPDR